MSGKAREQSEQSRCWHCRAGGRAGGQLSLTLGQAAGRVALAEAHHHHTLHNLQGVRSSSSNQENMSEADFVYCERCHVDVGAIVGAVNLTDRLLKGRRRNGSMQLSGHHWQHALRTHLLGRWGVATAIHGRQGLAHPSEAVLHRMKSAVAGSTGRGGVWWGEVG